MEANELARLRRSEKVEGERRKIKKTNNKEQNEARKRVKGKKE